MLDDFPRSYSKAVDAAEKADRKARRMARGPLIRVRDIVLAALILTAGYAGARAMGVVTWLGHSVGWGPVPVLEAPVAFDFTTPVLLQAGDAVVAEISSGDLPNALRLDVRPIFWNHRDDAAGASFLAHVDGTLRAAFVAETTGWHTLAAQALFEDGVGCGADGANSGDAVDCPRSASPFTVVWSQAPGARTSADHVVMIPPSDGRHVYASQ